MIEKFNISFSKNITCVKPLGFKEALYLWKDAEVVLTDSGGLQEETTALSIPCVTIRNNTERPITVEMGSNILAGTDTKCILSSYLKSKEKKNNNKIPPLWDGKAAERIWKIILDYNT